MWKQREGHMVMGHGRGSHELITDHSTPSSQRKNDIQKDCYVLPIRKPVWMDRTSLGVVQWANECTGIIYTTLLQNTEIPWKLIITNESRPTLIITAIYDSIRVGHTRTISMSQRQFSYSHPLHSSTDTERMRDNFLLLSVTVIAKPSASLCVYLCVMEGVSHSHTHTHTHTRTQLHKLDE